MPDDALQYYKTATKKQLKARHSVKLDRMQKTEMPKSKTKMSGKKNSSLKVVKRIISKSILGHSKVISRSLDIFKKTGCGKAILCKKKYFSSKWKRLVRNYIYAVVVGNFFSSFFFMFLEHFRSGQQFLFKKKKEKWNGNLNENSEEIFLYKLFWTFRFRPVWRASK